MPSKPVQVELPDGRIIWARVPVEGPTNVSTTGLAKLDADELRNTVLGVSESLRDAVQDLLPHALQVEFGLELSLKTGKLTSMLAEAGGKASIKVTLTWQGGDAQPADITLRPSLADDGD